MLFKFFVGLLFVCNFTISECDKMNEIRQLYHEISSEETLDEFLLLSETTNCDEKTPYEASAIMLKAEYTNWPFKKLRYFKDGKNMLEAYIADNSSSLEARYIRLLTQMNAPSFLNYHKNKLEDSTFIHQNIGEYGISEEYKLLIMKTINSNNK